MNKYRDMFLDDLGVNELDKIVYLSDKNPIEALELLDKLISHYPKSPQLWISKSIITPSKYNEERIEYCKNAIELDIGFFDGYYFLARNQILGTTIYCNCESASERLDSSSVFMNWVMTFRRDSNIAFAELDHRSELFFVENWDQWYGAAMANEAQGFVKMDRNRYSQEEISELAKAHIMFRDAVPIMRKFLVMSELARSLGMSLS